MSIPEFTILPLRPTDRAGVRLLLEQAFESPLEAQFVDQVARQHMSICEFVAVNGDHVLGHILFTPLDVRSPERAISSLALAPVSVLPDWQRKGIGSALIAAGLSCCRQTDTELVVVLGHPEYYPRFGFTAELGSQLVAPWSGPAFMALDLVPGVLDGSTAIVTYPDPFRVFDD